MVMHDVRRRGGRTAEACVADYVSESMIVPLVGVGADISSCFEVGLRRRVLSRLARAELEDLDA